MRVIILDKNSHLKFHSISLAFLVKKKDQKQISWEITRQQNKHSMTGFPVVRTCDFTVYIIGGYLKRTKLWLWKSRVLWNFENQFSYLRYQFLNIFCKPFLVLAWQTHKNWRSVIFEISLISSNSSKKWME